jgi:hypothetical protein
MVSRDDDIGVVGKPELAPRKGVIEPFAAFTG